MTISGRELRLYVLAALKIRSSVTWEQRGTPMSPLRSRRFVPAIWLAALCAGATAARADVVTNSPSLPVLDSPYIASASIGCFPTAMVCVSAGSLTLTSLVSSTFTGTEQDITADATYMGELTNLSNSPIGPLDLTGTVTEEILGRMSDTDTGTWTTDLTALSLSGPALGQTLDVVLDSSNASAGTTSVTPIGEHTYDIGSFFDIYLDLSIPGTPLSTSVGPVQASLQPVNEPASLALLAAPLLALAATRRRRAPSPA
jgi:hypothetical protein